MRSLEVSAPWHEEEEEVEVEDMEIGKHGRDDMTESSSDEATGRKMARRKNGGGLNVKKYLVYFYTFEHVY